MTGAGTGPEATVREGLGVGGGGARCGGPEGRGGKELGTAEAEYHDVDYVVI